MNRLILAALLPIVLASCGAKPDAGSGAAATPAGPSIEAQLGPFRDRTVDVHERARRILAAAKPGDESLVPVFIRLMKDRSQCIFFVIADAAAPFGYRVEENLEDETDLRANERTAAVMALEITGTWRALPDLLLALDDREMLVGVHAAHALLRLGNRAGIPTLLKGLEQKAYVNEHAHRLLKAASGKDFGFDSDSGLTRRGEAVARWKAWWEESRKSGAPLVGEGTPYHLGLDPDTDNRIRAHVGLLSAFQFLPMEQGRKMLQRLGPPAMPFLVEAVKRTHEEGKPTGRGGIAQVLGLIDCPEARALLAELRKDQNGAVRARAVEAEGRLGGADAVLAIKASLADQDASVVVAAVRALAAVGARADVPALDALRSRREPEIERALDFARLTLERTPEAFERAVRHLSAPLPNVRAEAADALNAFAGRAVLTDPDAAEDVRRAAVEEYRKTLGAK